MGETFTPPPTSAITPEDWQQTPARVQTWIREWCAENQQLRETVEQLREIANRNAQNSSQPPSQDRPDQKPAKEPLGQPRQRGGQPGHRGHHRALQQQRPVFDFMRDALIAYRTGQPAPSLLPAH